MSDIIAVPIAKYDSLTAMFTDIAGAIREKEGSEGVIPAEDFAERIRGLSDEAAISPGASTVWIITESGTWTVPYTGRYNIELHGGGGGGCGEVYNGGYYWGGSGGGGSGELFTEIFLTKGQVISVSIGKGGALDASTSTSTTGGNGGATVFGDYSVAGGYGGRFRSYGAKSGSLASNGITGSSGTSAPISGGSGGSGGSTFLDYGSGGAGQDGIQNPGAPAGVVHIVNDGGSAGTDGAAIITYLGKDYVPEYGND